jgi:formiminotetrahydrofolate cyclodeaminase
MSTAATANRTLLGDPATGGRAAAIAGAMAAELTRAAARSGRWEDAPGAAAQAGALQRRLLELGELDRHAHAEALRALEDRSDPRLADRLATAAEVPLLICAAAADTAMLAATVSEHAEAPIWADAASAAVLAAAAAGMAAHLVTINLAVGGDDRRATLARKYEGSAADAARRARAAG